MPSMSSATTSNPLRCGKKQRSLCVARFRSLVLTATVQRRAIRDLLACGDGRPRPSMCCRGDRLEVFVPEHDGSLRNWSNALCTCCAQVSDAGVAVDGHE
jgi:hypothetical protein